MIVAAVLHSGTGCLEQITMAPRRRLDRRSWWLHVDGQEPLAYVQPTKPEPMNPSHPRRQTQANASFHDATAKEVYASWFRPIAFPAVAAGTRRPVAALDIRAEDVPSRLAGVLRNGFDD